MTTTDKITLKKLTNQNLDLNLKTLVAREREILSEILLHIAEVERRKLYLIFGYPSLFEYLTKSIGYSYGSAQRRIDAARLSFEIPEVINKLESGEINLAQVSLVQKSIREVRLNSKGPVNKQLKENLIEQISGKSFAESEVLVTRALDIKLKEQVRISHQQNESVRLEVTLSKTQWEKLNKMRELLSNSLPSGSNGSWDQVLEYVSEKVIQQKDNARASSRIVRRSEESAEEAVPTFAGSNKTGANSKQAGAEEKSTAQSSISNEQMSPRKNTQRTPIPMQIQRQVHLKDKCCQYKDKTTGKQCGSTWKLNLDHIQPLWAGGENKSENLRLLCAAHNRQIYQQQANIFHAQR